MKQLNVAVSDEAHKAAKDAAEEAGMILRRWVERAILAAAGKTEEPRKLTYEPLE